MKKENAVKLVLLAENETVVKRETVVKEVRQEKMVFEGQLVHKVYKVYKVLLDQKARKGIKVTVVKKAQKASWGQ